MEVEGPDSDRKIGGEVQAVVEGFVAGEQIEEEVQTGVAAQTGD